LQRPKITRAGEYNGPGMNRVKRSVFHVRASQLYANVCLELLGLRARLESTFLNSRALNEIPCRPRTMRLGPNSNRLTQR
ncbi:hypothetical protein BaRGS_00037232, partial [Batillaria attramentaria]